MSTSNGEEIHLKNSGNGRSLLARAIPLSPRSAFSALILVVTMIGAGGLAAGASPKTSQAGQPEGCTKPNHSMELYAVELPRDKGQIRLGYGKTPETAS